MLADGSFQPSSQHTNCKKKKRSQNPNILGNKAAV